MTNKRIKDFALRLLPCILTVVVLFGCASCAPTPTPTQAPTEEQNCAHTWSATKGACLVCGEACMHDLNVVNEKTYDHVCKICKNRSNHDYKQSDDGYTCALCGEKTIFEIEKTDGQYLTATDKKGSIVTVEYDTYAYALAKYAGKQLGKEVSYKEIPVKKTAFVYLPYNYDPSREYDILYLLHGNGESAGYWFGTGEYEDKAAYSKDAVTLLDNMMASGEAKETIVVTPGLFTYAPEGSKYAEYNEAMYEANDETDLTLHYHLELRDMIKMIENKYSTYAKGDVSDESLNASRAHRAYAGLSRGSRTAFGSVISSCLDIFGYVGNFSLNQPEVMTSVEIADNVLKVKEDGYHLYYWYMACGSSDNLYDGHFKTAMEVYEKCNEDETLVDGKSFSWVKHPGSGHSFVAWLADLCNCMKVFFK